MRPTTLVVLVSAVKLTTAGPVAEPAPLPIPLLTPAPQAVSRIQSAFSSVTGAVASGLPSAYALVLYPLNTTVSCYLVAVIGPR